jgi:hypothetical protein
MDDTAIGIGLDSMPEVSSRYRVGRIGQAAHGAAGHARGCSVGRMT